MLHGGGVNTCKSIAIFIISLRTPFKILKSCCDANYEIRKNKIKTRNNLLIIRVNIAILLTLCEHFGRYGTNIFTKISCLSCRLATDYRAE